MLFVEVLRFDECFFPRGWLAAMARLWLRFRLRQQPPYKFLAGVLACEDLIAVFGVVRAHVGTQSPPDLGPLAVGAFLLTLVCLHVRALEVRLRLGLRFGPLLVGALIGAHFSSLSVGAFSGLDVRALPVGMTVSFYVGPLVVGPRACLNLRSLLVGAHPGTPAGAHIAADSFTFRPLHFASFSKDSRSPMGELFTSD